MRRFSDARAQNVGTVSKVDVLTCNIVQEFVTIEGVAWLLGHEGVTGPMSGSAFFSISLGDLSAFMSPKGVEQILKRPEFINHKRIAKEFDTVVELLRSTGFTSDVATAEKVEVLTQALNNVSFPVDRTYPIPKWISDKIGAGHNEFVELASGFKIKEINWTGKWNVSKQAMKAIAANEHVGPFMCGNFWFRFLGTGIDNYTMSTFKKHLKAGRFNDKLTSRAINDRPSMARDPYIFQWMKDNLDAKQIIKIINRDISDYIDYSKGVSELGMNDPSPSATYTADVYVELEKELLIEYIDNPGRNIDAALSRMRFYVNKYCKDSHKIV